MIVALTEQHATDATLPAIFDMQQFMALEVMNCIERTLTHVARKGRLGLTLVLSEICLTCEMLSTVITDKGDFFVMQFFVFHELWYIGEALIALRTLISTCWSIYTFKEQNGTSFV